MLIQGLTLNQKMLLDEMWKCETQEDLQYWQSTLDHEDAFEVGKLVELVCVEALDEVMDDDMTEAHDVIARIQEQSRG